MRTKILIFLLLSITASAFSANQFISQRQNEPWTQQQLLPPAELANVLNNPKAPQPIVFSIGMEAIIKNSIDIGPVMMGQNLNLLKQKLNNLPKNAQIVVYCGCCPFASCPNVRPAMQLLKDMQFTNYKLLNLPDNIKVDWIDKNYPMVD
jgi:thiosulfate/3-mercaptopyruvate sulfurtransferase